MKINLTTLSNKIIALLLLGIFILLPTNTYVGYTNPYSNDMVEGFIVGWMGENVKIEAYDGTVHILSFEEGAFFEIDNRPAKPTDFKIGMEVYAHLNQSMIRLLESYSTEIPGYIPPGGKIITGVVQRIDTNQIYLKLPSGEVEIFNIIDTTIINKKGVMVPYTTLYEGDKVKLYFDEVDTELVSRIEIQNESVIIKDVYKGKLRRADYYTNSLVLENVEVLKNGKWEKIKSFMTIPYSYDIPLYVGGQKIFYHNLKYYTGKTVYMAVNEYFGRNQVEKMVIKNQFETTYSEKIKEINWYAESFELGNKKNINFHEGTMIVKNGRLIDSYGLQSNSDAFIVAESNKGSLMADLMYIYNEDINNSNAGQNYLYTGRLDELFQDSIKIKDYYRLEQNEWDYHGSSSTKELYYDEDTYIYDLEIAKFIKAKEFYYGNYAVDEDSYYARVYNLNDWYGYIYTDGVRITSIILMKNKDSLTGQRISTGTIEDIVDDSLIGWITYLKNGCDWSSLKERWMERNNTTRINIEKAMIIKDGKMVTPKELQNSDRLYIVRDDFFAKVIIVK